MGQDNAWSWLNAQGVLQSLINAIRQVLSGLWTEGFAMGDQSAREVLDSGYHSSFWDDWEPGDQEAAARVSGDGLQHMLDNYGIATIKAIAETRMNQLADKLAEGADQGWGGEQIAKEIRPILDNPGRAQMIADTELARAVSMASQDVYRDAGVNGKKWSLTPDDRVCQRCIGNKEQGIIPMGSLFQSGVPVPPAHPNCRCAMLPADLPGPVTKGHPQRTPAEVHLRESNTARRCASCAMFHPLPPDFETGRCDILPVNVQDHQVCDEWVGGTSKASPDELVAGGLAIVARDTGRVLMLQRSVQKADDDAEDDPAAGRWEFPGGKMDDGEGVETAARREWHEETGLPVPAGRTATTWDQGVYRGFVQVVPSEEGVPILHRKDGINPDDPDNDMTEALAWFDPQTWLRKGNEHLREELRAHPRRIRQAIRAALDGRPAQKSAPPSPLATRVYRQLLEDYPAQSVAWVLRCRWEGPLEVPWDRLDHDSMRQWAAWHQSDKVQHFRELFERGEPVKPAILADLPHKSSDDLLDVDGHHRALAAHAAGVDLPAYIGYPEYADVHDVLETHLYQKHSRDPNSTAYPGKVAVPAIVKVGPKGYIHGWIYVGPGSIGRTINHDQYGTGTIRDKGKGLISVEFDQGGSHTFTHRETGAQGTHYFQLKPEHAPEGYCKDHCGNRTKGGHYLPGHDARHVGMLAGAVNSGEIGLGQAERELGHSTKLQDKLYKLVGDQTGAFPEPKPEPKPIKLSKPDDLNSIIREQGSVAALDELEKRSHDDQGFRRALRSIKEDSDLQLLYDVAYDRMEASVGDERRNWQRIYRSLNGERYRRIDARNLKERARQREEEKARRNAAGGFAHEFATSGHDAVAEIYGTQRQERRHTATMVFPKKGNEGKLAHMGWQGEMGIREDVAEKLKKYASDPDGIVDDPDVYAVILHELTHATGYARPYSTAQNEHMMAYGSGKFMAGIEEGFTELGTSQHAPEFVRAMGVGDRETAILSSTKVRQSVPREEMAAREQMSRELTAFVDFYGPRPGHATVLENVQDASHMVVSNPSGARVLVSTARNVALGDDVAVRKLDILLDNWPQESSGAVHLTVAELADRYADPERIGSGRSWNHYPKETKAAQDFVRAVAMQELLNTGSETGYVDPAWMKARMVELADEINRKGPAGKVPAMARQIVYSQGIDPDKIAKGTSNTQSFAKLAETNLKIYWGEGPSEAVRKVAALVQQWERLAQAHEQ